MLPFFPRINNHFNEFTWSDPKHTKDTTPFIIHSSFSAPVHLYKGQTVFVHLTCDIPCSVAKKSDTYLRSPS
jgi:hypothetical protein